MRLKELFLKPLLSQQRRIWGIIWSLAILSLSQGLLLFLIKGFVTALFDQPVTSDGTTSSVVALKSLLPASVDRYLKLIPDLSTLTIDRSLIAIYVPAAILIAGLIRAYAVYAYQLHQQALTLYMAKSYRERLFKALLSLPYIEIRRRSAAEWMSIIMNDVMFLQTRFNDVMAGVIRDGVAVIASFFFLTFLHWPSALALALVSPLIAFGMGRTGKRIAGYAETFQRELGRLAASVLDMRSRYDFIRAQDGTNVEEQRFRIMNNRYYIVMRRSIMIRSAFAPVLEFLGFAIFAGFLFMIGRGKWGRDFTPDLLLQFLAALGLLVKPLRNLGEQLSRFEETRGSLRASLQTFDRLESLAREGYHDDAHAQAALTQIFAGRQSARIRRLSTCFLGKSEPAVVAKDLSLKAAWAVAVIGPSGAGKSTLLKTLAGLLRPAEWQGDISWSECAASSSMVSQEPFLFDDTIEANLIYGLDSHPSERELWDAIRRVNIEAEIKKLPQGLKTRIRAIGSNISGGQLQRLVIARGLLRNRPLCLLDEATSAVDAKSERDITLRLIDTCHTQGVSLIAVTHRLQWIDAFDEVWFVEKGEILWAGKHSDLMAMPEAKRYRDFCSGQTQDLLQGT